MDLSCETKKEEMKHFWKYPWKQETDPSLLKQELCLESQHCEIIDNVDTGLKLLMDTAASGARGTGWAELCWGHRAAVLESPMRQEHICSNKVSFHAFPRDSFLSAVNVHKSQHFYFASDHTDRCLLSNSSTNKPLLPGLGLQNRLCVYSMTIPISLFVCKQQAPEGAWFSFAKCSVPLG